MSKIEHRIDGGGAHILDTNDISDLWIAIPAEQCPVCRVANLEAALRELLSGLSMWVKAVDQKQNRRPAYLAILAAQRRAVKLLPDAPKVAT
jgi:hypothetical protein